MITLVTISCVLAALAPVVSKRLSSNSVSIGGGFGSGGGSGKITMECTKSGKFGDGCKMCTDDLCIICSSGDPADKTKYLDPVDCKHKKCTEKYGENCLSCSASACSECKTTEYYVDGDQEPTRQCQPCPTGEVCDGIEIIECERVPQNGEYCDRDGNIQNCVDKWAYCAKCNVKECTECYEGFEKNKDDGECYNDSDWCSSNFLMRVGDLCVTKYNMGDHSGLPISKQVAEKYASSNVKLSCKSSSSFPCCWKASYNAATAATGDTANGGYSGLNRELCDWWAAKKVCEDFVYNGRRFRLPTKDELQLFSSESINKGNRGLMLCDEVADFGSALCARVSKCQGSYTNGCFPNFVWSETSAASGKSYSRDLNTGLWAENTTSQNAAMSVRCVAGETSACTTGYYMSSGKCEACSSAYPGCRACNSSACTECETGYTLRDGVCTQDTWCSGDSYTVVGNYCVTKYNIGDDIPIPAAANVTTVVISMGSSPKCTGGTKPCCWQGLTSDNCSVSSNGYSGCSRTVCNKAAANVICKALTYKGHTFAMAQKSVVTNFINSNQSRPQPCSDSPICSTTANGRALCLNAKRCIGASSNYCRPYYYWARSNTTTEYAQGKSYATYSAASHKCQIYYNVSAANDAQSVICEAPLN